MARLFSKRLVFRFGWTVAVLLFFFLASSPQAQARSAAPKAISLYDIQFDSRPEEMEIRINTNGRIPDYRVMQMFNPYRLVIDIPGLDNTSGKKKIFLNHPLVREVRIGQHPDRVRVVLDFPGEKIPSYQIIKKERGLVLTLKKDKTDETPVQKEPVPKPAAPVPAEKPEAMPPMPKGERPEGKLSEQKTPPARPVPVEVPAAPPQGPVPIQVAKPEAPKVSEPKAPKPESMSPSPLLRRKPGSTFGKAGMPAKPPEAVPAEKPEAKAPEPKAVQPAMAVPSPKIDQRLALTGEKRGAQPGEGPPAGAKTDVARLETPDYRGAKVSLVYRDADVREVLHKIAEVSGMNIIASEAVRGTITLRLVDVPWDQALDTILQNRNLAKIRQGNILLILTQPEFEQGKK